MRSVINFLRGSVCVAVSGPFPERFLNLCAQSGVGFWDLAWEGGQSLRLRVLRRDAGRAVELAERAGCTASLEGRAGLPAFLAGFRRRYALLAGLALALLTDPAELGRMSDAYRSPAPAAEVIRDHILARYQALSGRRSAAAAASVAPPGP